MVRAFGRCIACSLPGVATRVRGPGPSVGGTPRPGGVGLIGKKAWEGRKNYRKKS
jgi:hypothetical protein